MYVDNVDKLYVQAIAKGCRSLTEPNVQFWGDKTARLVDPFGYRWDIALKIA
ncbi:VOC family protein [Legionella tunisiensis]|uniref:VOC family protein n=1 Tax=Legionella tunisiensis TaxID=1034944 RepID=UPI0002F6C34E|nr:VOC family protein [Legionella tunisiensis]